MKNLLIGLGILGLAAFVAISIVTRRPAPQSSVRVDTMMSPIFGLVPPALLMPAACDTAEAKALAENLVLFLLLRATEEEPVTAAQAVGRLVGDQRGQDFLNRSPAGGPLIAAARDSAAAYADRAARVVAQFQPQVVLPGPDLR